MCLSSTPTAAPQNRPVQYMHNPYLDGNTIAGAGSTMGRNSLRIDLGTETRAAPTPTTGATPRPVGGPTVAPLAPAPAVSPLGSLTPGIVVPTIGGSLAGALPPPAPAGSRTGIGPKPTGVSTR